MMLSRSVKMSATVLLIFALSFSTSSAQKLASVYKVNFKTAKGKFLSATRKFEETVEAIVDDANTDELFIIDDENGGALESGDAVRLYAHSGYITIDKNSSLLAATGKPEESTGFSIKKVTGNGTIHPNDAIELITPSGAFITAEDNGKMIVQATESGDAALTLTSGVDNASIAEAFAAHWNRGYNITFDSSSQAIFGKKLQNPKVIVALASPGKQPKTVVATNTRPVKKVRPVKKETTATPAKATVAAKATTAKTAANNGLPASLPLGYYKCYTDHVANLALAGYFTLLPGSKYIYHGFDPNKRTGTPGTYRYDASSGKIEWLSGAWKSNKYYGLFSLDKVYGNRIYLIPIGSDYSACKCFLQEKSAGK